MEDKPEEKDQIQQTEESEKQTTNSTEQPIKKDIIPPKPPFKFTHSKKWITIEVILLLIVIVLATSYSFYRNAYKPKSPPLPATPTPKLTQTPTPDLTTNWKTYRNEKYGYQIKYPESLIPKQITDNDTYLEFVTFAKENGERDFLYSIYIRETSLEREVNIFRSQIEGHILVNLIRNENTQINGYPATLLEYQAQDPQTGPNNTYIIVNNGKYSFVISIVSDKADQILSTFKFLPDTSGWKTYSNEELGISFKYPNNLYIFTDPNVPINTPFEDRVPLRFYNKLLDAEACQAQLKQFTNCSNDEAIGINLQTEPIQVNLDDTLKQFALRRISQTDEYHATIQFKDITWTLIAGGTSGDHVGHTAWSVQNNELVMIDFFQPLTGNTDLNNYYPLQNDLANQILSTFEFIDSISLTTNKAEYIVGKEIVFTINNNTDRTIYYSYGCSWPQPYLIMNGESYTLTTNIYEEVPPIKEIKPEESEICIWNQKAWFNPYKKPPEKYSDNLKEGLVPSGEYQLRFNYYLSEDDVYYNRNMRSVYSQVIETVLI